MGKDSRTEQAPQEQGARSQVAQSLSRIADAEDPLAALAAARELREAAEDLELDLVRSARQAKVSWARIGQLYGLTKQGAQQRFRKENPETKPAENAPTDGQ